MSLDNHALKMAMRKMGNSSLQYSDGVFKLALAHANFIWKSWRNRRSGSGTHSAVLISGVDNALDRLTRNPDFYPGTEFGRIDYRQTSCSLMQALLQAPVLLSMFVRLLRLSCPLHQAVNLSIAYAQALIVEALVLPMQPKKVLLYGHSYRLNVFFTAALLQRRKNIEVIVFEDTGFLESAQAIIADEIRFIGPWQERYAAKVGRDFFDANKLGFLFPVNSHQIPPPRTTGRGGITDQIAIYSSGLYARQLSPLMDEKFTTDGVAAERRLTESIIEYAKQHPDKHVTLYIHLTNGVESVEGAQREFATFLALPNTSLQDQSVRSYQTFDEYELGVTCISEVFFEALSKRHKCVLLYPFIEGQFLQEAGLLSLAINGPTHEDAVQALEKFRTMSTKDFFALVD